MAYATKEMGVRTRHDTIEDRLDHHNHEKNVKMGATLERKLKLVLVEERKQVLEFEQVNETLEDEVQELWEGMFEAWYQNRKTAMTPFAPTVEDGVTEAEVRLQLKKEDAEDARRNKTDVDAKSPTSFVMLGLELEDSQHWLKADLVSVSKMTTSELAKQEVFMPAGIKAVMDKEEKRDANALPPKAEDIKLWLPSDIPAIHCQSGCKEGIVKREKQLRQAQCSDALSQHLIKFRNAHVVGQQDGMRSKGLIDTVSERVAFYAAKYHVACRALLALVDDESECEEFHELSPDHIPLDEEVLKDAASMTKLALIGSRQIRVHSGATVREGSGSKKKKISWIWTYSRRTGGDKDEEDNKVHIHESVQVEWSKAKARKERWAEEVLLLKEEM
ncbi:hypothetical protein C8J56DRAFT_1040026 [Mycena floridula]|nr:hypothetical protein C8J56DRAFT_1040026 [Mycena floridula]